MAIYAIYKFEVQEGSRSLFYKDTGKRTIEMANAIVADLLRDGMTIVGKKRGQDQPLKSLDIREHGGVFTWVLCNVKDITKYEGHEKDTLESHPGCFVIFDSRPGVCQIAIERNSAFYSDTDKVVGHICRTFNMRLPEYGLKMVVKRKFQAGKFMDLVRRRILRDHDFVRRIVWEFPNPGKVQGIDADHRMRSHLQALSLLTRATNALSGRLELKGSKSVPLCVDDDEIEGLAQIIALSAQNGYKLTYYFYNSSAINIKDVACACHTIEGRVIRDFENGPQCMGEHGGETYELVQVLDHIREEIADHNENVVDSGE